MKNLDLITLEEKELSEINGGFVIPIAVGIAIGVTFIAGVVGGITLYGVTHQCD